MPKRSVLVTGAAGNIGRYFCPHVRSRYRLTMMVHASNTPAQRRPLRNCGKVIDGDIGEIDRLVRTFRGIDTIVHLAGQASPLGEWDSLLPVNIVGTYNVLLAAKAAGCRRVIYASSIHAVSGYPPDVQVHADAPVNPGDLYGVSKCFGEALCRYMAEQEGLSCIAIRIGAFQPTQNARADMGLGMLDYWISPRDLTQLICKSIDVENLPFAILHGVSNNRFKFMDISQARRLVGYEPQDDVSQLHPKLRPLQLNRRATQTQQYMKAHSAVGKHVKNLKRS